MTEEMTDGGPHGGTVQPKKFYIGDNTMSRVFAPLGITDVSDQNMQALWDRVEVMLAAPVALNEVVVVDRSLLEAACKELRQWKVDKGGDDQVVLNLEAVLQEINNGE